MCGKYTKTKSEIMKHYKKKHLIFSESYILRFQGFVQKSKTNTNWQFFWSTKSSDKKTLVPNHFSPLHLGTWMTGKWQRINRAPPSASGPTSPGAWCSCWQSRHPLVQRSPWTPNYYHHQNHHHCHPDCCITVIITISITVISTWTVYSL